MIKNKSILFTFTFLAWAIIFIHSIVPHNHHSETDEECKSHANQSTESYKSHDVAFFSGHNQQSENHSHCHFNISTTLTNYVDSPNVLFTAESIIIPLSAQVQTIYFENQVVLLKHFYFDSFTHRGPPSFS